MKSMKNRYIITNEKLQNAQKVIILFGINNLTLVLLKIYFLILLFLHEQIVDHYPILKNCIFFIILLTILHLSVRKHKHYEFMNLMKAYIFVLLFCMLDLPFPVLTYVVLGFDMFNYHTLKSTEFICYSVYCIDLVINIVIGWVEERQVRVVLEGLAFLLWMQMVVWKQNKKYLKEYFRRFRNEIILQLLVGLIISNTNTQIIIYLIFIIFMTSTLQSCLIIKLMRPLCNYFIIPFHYLLIRVLEDENMTKCQKCYPQKQESGSSLTCREMYVCQGCFRDLIQSEIHLCKICQTKIMQKFQKVKIKIK